MKEHKFRARYNGKWLHGLNSKTGSSLFGETFLGANWLSEVSIEEHKNVIVEQFVFLKDRTGVEIYVGDILEEVNPRSNRYRVFNVKGGFAINCFQDDLDKENIVFYESLADMQTSSFIQTCVVIGNIHDNDDLIKLKRKKR